MNINCTDINITEKQAIEIAVMEHPDIITRLFWLFIPKIKRTVKVTEVRLFYCKYYLVTGIISAKKKIDYHQNFSASMYSVARVARMFVGVPELLEKEVLPSQVLKPIFSSKDAREKILNLLMKNGYKKYRVLPTIDIKSEEAVYRPFYACICEKNGKKSVRIIDAQVAEREYLLELKYKDFQYMG